LSIQLNLSQDEVDYIITAITKRLTYRVQEIVNGNIDIDTLDPHHPTVNTAEIITEIQYQAKPQWVHVGNKPSPQWTKEDSQ
jgi:hypothetical protein